MLQILLKYIAKVKYIAKAESGLFTEISEINIPSLAHGSILARLIIILKKEKVYWN